MSHKHFSDFKPEYQDDHNYQLNAKSFFHYLGKSNKFLEIMGERIEDYDEEIQRYFERWEDNLETVNDDVIDMMMAWLDDGTLDEIFNNELLQRKVEIIIAKEEPETTFENTYWYQDVGNSGLQQNLYRTNVSVSEDEPQDEQYNVWLDY